MMGHSPGSCVTDKYHKHFSEDARRNTLIKLPDMEQTEKVLPAVAKKVATRNDTISLTYKVGDNNSLTYLEENGAGDEIRTHDLNLGKVSLYP